MLDADPQLQDRCLNALGKDSHDDILTPQQLQELRDQFAEVLKSNGQEPCDNGPTSRGLIASGICGGLLNAWADLAQDPGCCAAKWILEGAPAGIEAPMSELQGVMEPVIDPPDVLPIGSLADDKEFSTNHGNLDDDEDAVELLRDMTFKLSLIHI